MNNLCSSDGNEKVGGIDVTVGALRCHIRPLTLGLVPDVLRIVFRTTLEQRPHETRPPCVERDMTGIRLTFGALTGCI
jgi:hypothetical protein